MSMYRSKVKYVFKNGIFQCEQLTIASGSVLHIHVRVIYYIVIDITNGMKGLHSILTMNFVQDY